MSSVVGSLFDMNFPFFVLNFCEMGWDGTSKY